MRYLNVSKATLLVALAICGVLTATRVDGQGGVPGPATNVRANVSGNVLELLWDPPSSGGLPTNYVVIARTTSGQVITTANSWPDRRLIGSVPNGVYLLSIQASNAAGTGAESPAITATVPAVPPGGPGSPGAPTNLQGAVSGNSIVITWAPPATGAAPTNYVLTVRDTAGAILAQQNVWPTPRLEGGGVPDGEYVLSVRASNAAGNGPESAPVTIRVPSAPPPGAGAPGTPTNFQAAVSGNTLTLTWSPPSSGGAPTNYAIIARNSAGVLLASTPIGLASPLTVGAVPNGVYVLTLQASNAAGAGPESAARTITVPDGTTPVPGAPGQPTSVTATVSGGTVTLSWSAPTTGGPVESYVLRTALTPGGPPAATGAVTGTSTSVTGVANGTYYVTVTAVNAFGNSPPSSEVTITVGAVGSTSRSTMNPNGVPLSIEARSSMVTTGLPPYTTVDDFIFSGGSTLRQLQWQGIYCVEQDNAAAPAPTATGFVIRVHPDVAGRPNMNAALATAQLSLAQANQVSQGTFVNASCGNASNTRWALYNYAATLPAAFTAAPGVRYWLSIQATTPSYSAHWGWRGGTTDNRFSITFYNGSTFNQTVDRAFALTP